LPYPMLVERWLRAANPGRSIEVVPLATPGYSSHQGLAWLRRDIGWLQPDVVTVCFGWHDIDLRGASDAQTMPDGWLRVTARRRAAGRRPGPGGEGADRGRISRQRPALRGAHPPEPPRPPRPGFGPARLPAGPRSARRPGRAFRGARRPGGCRGAAVVK